MSTDLQEYRKRIAEAYDGEIFGAAFFAELAGRFAADAGRRRKCELMRDVELETAGRLRPLVARLGLPWPDEHALAVAGRHAATTVIDWDRFIERFRKLAPGFVASFEEIAAIAPVEDPSTARFLIDHELAFVEFTEREAAGDAESLSALRAVLQTTDEDPAASGGPAGERRPRSGGAP
jgi:hypothetical protein